MKRKKGRKLQSMKTKILLLNLCVVIIAFFCFCGLFIYFTTNQQKESALHSAQSSLEQADIILEEQTAALRNRIDALTLDPKIIQLLNTDYTSRYEDRLLWNVDHATIVKTISEVLFRSNIKDIQIVTDAPISARQSATVLPVSQLQDSPWYRYVGSRNFAYSWMPGSSLYGQEGESIIFTRKLSYTYPAYETYFVGVVGQDLMSNLLEGSVADKYTTYYIVNKNNDLLSFTKNIQRDFRESIQNWLAQQHEIRDGPVAVQSFEHSGKKYLLGAQQIYNTDLTLICTYDTTEMFWDTVRQNVAWMLGVFLICLPLILVLSHLLSKSITKPITELKKSMRNVGNGDFTVPSFTTASNQEVSALTAYYQTMLLKIEGLMDAQYQQGKKLKALELKALQAQINPHFLYNTLDLLKWRAVKSGDQETQDIVSALSVYYRRSLGKGADFVPLSHELEHVESYTSIQNFRYDHDIHLRIQVPNACADSMIPKLTLQPIVENAILHGILEKDEEKGEIIISATDNQGHLVLAVKDDGCGMSQERLASLLDKSEDNPALQSGYGLRNIDQRLRLFFGPGYGLHFESNLGEGTTVYIEIPFRRMGEIKDV